MTTAPASAEPREGPAASLQGGWRSVVGSLAGVALGGVFLVAVWGKVFDPEAFAEVIRIEGLDFWLPATTVAVLALAIEAAVGAAFVLNLRRLYVLLPTALLIAFFLFLTARAWVRDVQGIRPEEVSCGCFGHLVDRTPAEAFWQDFLLLVPPLALSFLGRPRGRPVLPVVRVGLTGAFAAGVLLLAVKAPDLPLDDLATRLRPGKKVAEICAGSGRERLCLAGEALAHWLTEGEHVVVIADLASDAFAAEVADRVDEIVEFAALPDAPRVLVLYSGTKDDVAAFGFKSRAPPFDYQDAPATMLRPLYRRLPRTFTVVDGVVTRTFPGLPPLREVWSRAAAGGEDRP